LALIAQAAAYKLRQKLPKPYRQWTAAMLSEKLFTNMEGDIKVKDDYIIVTFYRDHEYVNLKNQYNDISSRLEREGISPKIPWLCNYKLKFRFK